MPQSSLFPDEPVPPLQVTDPAVPAVREACHRLRQLRERTRAMTKTEIDHDMSLILEFVERVTRQ